MNDTPPPVVIVGAGLAGLNCAVTLHRKGRTVLVLDAADQIGGRVWTDNVDGFLLDRGFQVLNPAYPALAPWLPHLTLKPFIAGARIALPDGQQTLVADPLRHPQFLGQTLVSPVGSWLDKLALLRLRAEASRGLPLSLERLPDIQPAVLVQHQLPQRVSPGFIQRFFRPFFGGVLLDYDGDTRWDYWLWLFQLFTRAQVCLPEGGMAALPMAMADQLPPNAIRLSAPVSQVSANGVTLFDGETIPAQSVVVAADGHTAARLLNLSFNPGRRGTTCVYYVWSGSLPDACPVLGLNGRGEGLVNNWCFPTAVQPGYAPAGKHLLSVSVLGVPNCTDAELDRLIQAELQSFILGVPVLRLLKIYRIPFAQPHQMATQSDVPRQINGVWIAGDWMSTPSIQGALASGFAAADAISS